MAVQIIEGDPEKTEFAYVRGRGVNSIKGPRGLPLTKPPFSRVTAIDLNTGDHLWMKPLGDGLRQTIIDKGFADPGPVGGGFPGGPLLTKTLLFIAEGGRRNTDWVLRAFDKHSGEVLAEIALPAPPTGAPMTYMINGKQYIVLASGYAASAKLIALALP